MIVQDQDQVQKPIYFISKVLQGPEERYQAIEKVALAVVFTTKRLRHYFHSFTVIVMTDLLIRKVLQKPDIAGRIVRSLVELSEFDIHYEPSGPIKGQVYADFLIELMYGSPHPDPRGFRWILSVDGSSNHQGSGVGVILEGPSGLLIEPSLKFAFKANNNQAEYEALIAGAVIPGVRSSKPASEERLVTCYRAGNGQISGQGPAIDSIPQVRHVAERSLL